MHTPSILPPEREQIRPRAWTRPEFAPWLLAAAVLACGLLWLGSEGTYDGDERYYIDATLRMLAHGDWWRPEFADGSARLNKPLLDYWLIGASFQVFGASLFAARLPFLIAGALTVALTGQVARALFPSEPRAPLLASAIATSNVVWAALIVRCTPDILLVLATTIAWVGLAELLVADRPRRSAPVWLWLGIGLAAAAKGGLAVVLVVFVIAVGWWKRRARAGRELVHVPSMLLAFAGAAVCIAPLWLADVQSAGDSFIQDQVASRITTAPLDIALNAGAYLGSLVRHNLPWVLAPLVLFFAARSTLRSVWSRHRRGILPVLLFTLTLFVVFAVSNTHRGRYLAPAYPALACVFAVFVLPTAELAFTARALRILVATAAVLAVLTAFILVRIDAFSAVLVVVAGVLPALWMRRVSRSHLGTTLAFSIAAVLLVLVPAIRDAFRSDYYAIAAEARRVDATWGFDPSTPNVVRVLSAGRLDPRPWPKQPSSADFDSAEVVLVTGPASDELAARDWHLQPCGFRTRHMRARDVPHLFTESDPRTWFAGQGQPVFLAHR